MKSTAPRRHPLRPALPPFFVSLGILALASAGAPHPARATGNYDDEAVPSLPYYLDRLPAKSPAQVFRDTAPPAPEGPEVDYPAALAALAKDAEASGSAPVNPAPLLAKVDNLLAHGRLSTSPAAYCNFFNDLHDLFAATPPVPGKAAGQYIRWRVAHAVELGLVLVPDPKPGAKPAQPGTAPSGGDSEKDKAATGTFDDDLLTRADSKGPLQAHWMYLRAAFAYPGDRTGPGNFQKVVDAFPDHPRAEAARFMIARCRFNATRQESNPEPGADTPDPAKEGPFQKAARDAFEDYLKRYPKGRFTADAKGWLGALDYDEEKYLPALNDYLEQADTPGHPEVLKSAGFMCERCLAHLCAEADDRALEDVAAHPRLAMSLVYLLVNTTETDNYNGKFETPEQVAKWRRALLPRLAKAVTAHEAAFHDGAAAGWHARYLAILAQAASGAGDQKRALALCAMGKGEIEHSDDLAFIQLVALQRARQLPEAIGAARAFVKNFPDSVFCKGARLRLALALQDNHQAGLALVELSRLKRGPSADKDKKDAADPDPGKGNEDEDAEPDPKDAEHLHPYDSDPTKYPSDEESLDAEDSVLRVDISGAEIDQIEQIIDALLCFAPPSELLPALDAGKDLEKGAAAVRWRAVLAQRYLGDDENFAEAKKYVTPAQWSLAAADLEKLASAAAAKPRDADTLLRLADGWAAVRGKIVFSPLETDQTRETLLGGEPESAGLHRRENGLALGIKPEAVDHALESHDEMRHAMRWWLKAADAAPAGSPARARALWSALKAMPGVAFASPYMLARANDTDMGAASHALYDRLRRECPGSREAKEFAAYYEFPPLPKPTVNGEEEAGDDKADADKPGSDKAPDKAAPDAPDAKPGDPPAADAEATAAATPEPNPSTLPYREVYGETEYVYKSNGAFNKKGGSADEDDDNESADADLTGLLPRVVALKTAAFTSNPARMAAEVAAIRKDFRAQSFSRNDTALLNFLDDLTDVLKEPAAKLTSDALKNYVELRLECIRVEGWGGNWGDALPPLAGAKAGADSSGGSVDDAVLDHIRAAYKLRSLAPLKDYLDFLALAVIANHSISDDYTKEELAGKDGGEAGFTTRDYPKLAKLAAQFLIDHPHSNKREAARLLVARALYNTSRPVLFSGFGVWPACGHFQGGNMLKTHRGGSFDPRQIGAALNAYDKEFPDGRYAAEIRNLRALLAWHTQDWGIALDLTIRALDDENAPDLQPEAAARLANVFSDGFTDETERARMLAAVKARPEAVKCLRAYLPKSDYPLRIFKAWIEAQL